MVGFGTNPLGLQVLPSMGWHVDKLMSPMAGEAWMSLEGRDGDTPGATTGRVGGSVPHE
jgi:hypothetical protein